MKMKYISLAVMAALSTTALTACGGSDGGNDTVKADTTVADKAAADKAAADKAAADKAAADKAAADKAAADKAAADKAAADKAAADANKNNDTTKDDTVANDTINPINNDIKKVPLDSKQSTVGQQYIRNSASKFDYISNTNSANNGSNTAVSSMTLNEQNPEMTNIVLGLESQKVAINGVDTPVKVIRYAGARKTDGSNTLQMENENSQNKISGGEVTYGSGLTKTTVQTGSFANKIEQLYTEESRNDHARIFGRNSNADIQPLGSISNAPNSYAFPLFKADGTLISQAAVENGNILARPIVLQNVQYGRVSNNIDPLSQDQVNKLQADGTRYSLAEFANRNDAGTVNTYFYRGTGETGLTDMPTSGKYQYAGHALTYGLDNLAGGGTVVPTPNAFGTDTTSTTIGSFVGAEYDAAKKTVNGQIYNMQVKDNKLQSPTPLTLVTFTGDVHGNTVLGTSTKVQGNEAGAFTGTFYGSQAAELGGAVNNITEGYGQSKWGAVFGAQKVIDPKAPTPVVDNAPKNGFIIDDSGLTTTP